MTPSPLSISRPVLSSSALAYRIGLARQRTALHPMDRLDFILMDLERPDLSSRHAHWCTGDLSGRTLEFLSAAEGMDGRRDERLVELFERILRQRRPSGLIGRYAAHWEAKTTAPEEHLWSASHRLFPGLIRYFDLTNDWRALEAAAGLGDWLLSRKDEWVKAHGDFEGCLIIFWVTEPLAGLYRLTGRREYLDFAAMIGSGIKTLENQHSHGFMCTMRGLQLAALYTGDMSWNEKPEYFRRMIIDEQIQKADGCVSECFPRSFRNEGCSIADWVMMNLYAGLLNGEDEPYAVAQNSLWNALFLNQFATGGFGHRDLSPVGYLMGPMNECWWCCTEHGGLAMTEYGRHAVTRRGETVWVNLLTPGRFALPGDDGREIVVTVSTSFPAGGEATITASGLAEGMALKVRVPETIWDARVEEQRSAGELTVRIAGRVGHWLQEYQDKVVLRYGPVVLAPMTYYWNVEGKTLEEGSTVPAEYVPASLPKGLPRLEVEADAAGRVAVSGDPVPDWSFWELGPTAPLSVEGASANVPVEFPDGTKQTLWFSPLCHATSSISYADVPILFRK